MRPATETAEDAPERIHKAPSERLFEPFMSRIPIPGYVLLGGAGDVRMVLSGIHLLAVFLKPLTIWCVSCMPCSNVAVVGAFCVDSEGSGVRGAGVQLVYMACMHGLHACACFALACDIHI